MALNVIQTNVHFVVDDIHVYWTLLADMVTAALNHTIDKSYRLLGAVCGWSRVYNSVYSAIFFIIEDEAKSPAFWRQHFQVHFLDKKYS